MKEIKLTKGQVAIVDDEDYERLNAYKWCAKFSRCTNSYYAMRITRSDASGKQRTILMHREVMNAQPGDRVDHINHDTRDQRRSNLRFCTASQNQANHLMQSNNTSGFKGVNWHKRDEKWQAQLRANGKYKYIGYFATALEAALAYDKAALELQGEFALTNRMLGLLPK